MQEHLQGTIIVVVVVVAVVIVIVVDVVSTDDGDGDVAHTMPQSRATRAVHGDLKIPHLDDKVRELLGVRDDHCDESQEEHIGGPNRVDAENIANNLHGTT